MSWLKSFYYDKKAQVVLFSSTAIALYGYDQGMMSLINTNQDYLSTMGISEESPQVGVIVSVYYLGCAIGAVFFSWFADKYGRKPGLFGCLAVTSLGNLIMFMSGLGYSRGALIVMYIGRIVMGLGVGGVDSVVPVYSSELSSDGARGKALAQEFQSNIFGLNMAFAINLGITVALGKYNEWSWRVPIVCMQVYPLGLLAVINRLPESPRWYAVPVAICETVADLSSQSRFVFHDKHDDAQAALYNIEGEDEGKKKYDEMAEAADQERDEQVSYKDMFTPGHPQFHPTMITIMGQVNQALTGYGGMFYPESHSEVTTPADHNYSCVCLRTSDLRAAWLRHPRVGVLDTGQLRLLLLPDDLRMAAGRRGWSADLIAVGFSRSDTQLFLACCVRRSGVQQRRPWDPCPGGCDSRYRHTVRRHRRLRYWLASHCLVDTNGDLPNYSSRTRHSCQCHYLGSGQLCGYVAHSDHV